MMTKTGRILWLLAAIGLPGIAQAEVPPHCLDQAREIALQAGDTVFPDMSANQRAQLQQLATDACAGNPGTPGSANTAGEESAGDWFTNRVLHGEPADKPGNRRLERRRRQ